MTSYFSSKTSLYSKWERYKYTDYINSLKKPVEKKDKKNPKPEAPSGGKYATFSSHRLRKQIPYLGKWNLFPIITSPSQSSIWQELTQNALEELYGHTAFWKEAKKNNPKLTQDLIQAFALQAERTGSLEDLFPEAPHLQTVFYKMMKGSGFYNYETKQGYPPFSDFFSFDSKNKSVCNFTYMPYPFLKAIFPEKTVLALMDLENKKWEKDGFLHSATKEDLRNLCADLFLKASMTRLQDIEPQLQFSHKKARLTKLTSPGSAPVYLEIPLPSSSKE